LSFFAVVLLPCLRRSAIGHASLPIQSSSLFLFSALLLDQLNLPNGIFINGWIISSDTPNIIANGMLLRSWLI
jgi:hypothetical protein